MILYRSDCKEALLHLIENNIKADLIYLDPPFNKKKTFTAPIGSRAEGAEFSDIFREEDVKEEWLETIKEDYDSIYSFLMGIKDYGNKYNFCYLAYMGIRLIEMRRVLKDTGSIYYHCDPTASHYIKIIMDGIFGRENFRNEIVWGYKSGGASKNDFAKKHDIVLRYSKTRNCFFHSLKYKRYLLRDEKTGKEIGKDPRKEKVKYYKDKIGTYRLNLMRDVWDDIGIISPNSKTERLGYPTQKPLALLDRIIKASCPMDGIVLDPFCGCGTTISSAIQNDRKWIGIDISPDAINITKERIKELGAIEGESYQFKETRNDFK